MSKNVLKYGIDVSSHQETIDWGKVKASGKVDFAIIRVGFRGYGSNGVLNEDKQFKNNIKGASEQNIPIGLYFYSTALNETEAKEEAQFVLDRIGNYIVQLPIVYDFEGYNNRNYRTYGISKEQRTANYKAFSEIINNAGYEGLIYGSKAHIKNKFDIDNLDELIWLAAYPPTVDPQNPKSIGAKYDDRLAIWQCSSSGRVDGINAKVDLDYMYIDIIGKSNLQTEENNPYAAPTKTLYFGNTKMSEEDIKWLQWELVKDGYDTEINGKFTKTTTAILRDYQYNHGLGVDGKCGKATVAEML